MEIQESLQTVNVLLQSIANLDLDIDSQNEFLEDSTDMKRAELR